MGAWEDINASVFEIGGEDRLSSLRRHPQDPAAEARLTEGWHEWLRDARIRIGSLLKADNVNFLLGAGASKHVGGVLLGSVPDDIERELLEQGVESGQVAGWLLLFYEAAASVAGRDRPVPTARDAIAKRVSAPADRLPVNYEQLLSLLYRWRQALPVAGGTMSIDSGRRVAMSSQDLDECLRRSKTALARRCVLPKEGTPDPLTSHAGFLKKLLTRPLNLRRVNIFTLNYDTLIEQAADSEGVVALDGFIGTVRRVFRPESYDYDLYFPAETTEGRVHRLDRVIHLYKLHGSVDWKAEDPEWSNPYGITQVRDAVASGDASLVYPSPSKYGDTLGMPYAELFRRFASALVRPQSTLFTLGYGFGDDHVNAIIRQALAVPSFTLVVVDPYAPVASPTGAFVARLRARRDRRAWIVSGSPIAQFSSFVELLLPDLTDEEILRRVVETHRALAVQKQTLPTGAEDGE
jgi:hypothetical protein